MNALLDASLWIAAGAALGAGYFLVLRWNATLLARTGGPPFFALLLPLGRFAIIAVCLALIAMRFGAGPLLFTALGVFLARLALVRREQTPR